MEGEKKIDRRQFMSWITGVIGAIIGFGLGIPAIAYIIGPSLKKEETQNWISLGSILKVELGIPTLFKTKIQRQTGWIVNEEQVSIYVLTENGRDFVAMSNVCTHLGCRIRWIADREEFFCPCHNGVFDKDGRVVAGPPPIPLHRFETKIENEQLFVLGA